MTNWNNSPPRTASARLTTQWGRNGSRRIASTCSIATSSRLASKRGKWSLASVTHPGVVDEDVNAAETLGRCRDDPLGVVGVADVGSDSQRRLARRLDLGHGGFTCFRAPPRHHDPATLGGQLPRYGEADAARASGDDCASGRLVAHPSDPIRSGASPGRVSTSRRSAGPRLVHGLRDAEWRRPLSVHAGHVWKSIPCRFCD